MVYIVHCPRRLHCLFDSGYLLGKQSFGAIGRFKGNLATERKTCVCYIYVCVWCIV